jgi:hypothetical protein
VVEMDPGRPLAGDSAEPEAGGHGPVAAVGGRGDGGLPQDVGGIEAASLPEVEPGPADPGAASADRSPAAARQRRSESFGAWRMVIPLQVSMRAGADRRQGGDDRRSRRRDDLWDRRPF